MTATVEQVVPGVYDIPEDVYHADPVPGRSLSSSGARKLLPPSCPALFRYEQLNPKQPSKAFEVGTAAHKLVLGTGPELVLVDAERWDTKAIKQELADIRAAGNVPLKRAEYDAVHAMADAIRHHPIASVLFAPDRGEPEQTLIWQDPETGVWRRARLDWLPRASGGRMIVADYKTTQSAEPSAIQRAVHSYGYHQQAPWYLDGIIALGLAHDPAFVFVFQEKTPPYLITVVELDAIALRVGRKLNRRAICTYLTCVEAGRWPGYADEIELIALPAWAEHLQETL